jgi:hypothetical protein
MVPQGTALTGLAPAIKISGKAAVNPNISLTIEYDDP